MIDDLVSIITPAYNASNHISETIDSVIAQTYENWEMIIVNDCSIDNTLEIIKKYASNDNRIKVVDLPKNGGAANAWNEAFKIMEGRYVAFLDSDDLWINKKLEEQLKFMKSNNYYFTFGSYDWIDCNGDSLNNIIKIPQKLAYKELLKNTNIGLLTVMIDRSVIEIKKIPLVGMAWDFLLWTYILRQGHIAYGYNKVLGHYRILSNSASRNKKKAALGLWIIYREYLNINLIQSCYYFICYVYNSVKRYYFNRGGEL